MSSVISFLVNDFLTVPAILIGLLILLGYILQKSTVYKGLHRVGI